MKNLLIPVFITLTLILSSCTPQTSTEKTAEDTERELQEMFLNAESGDVIELPEGTFNLTRPLSLFDVEDVTIRGKGVGQTVLNFRNQQEGAEGIKIRSNNVTLEDFTVQDMIGDGVKIEHCQNITIRNVKVEWTDGSVTTNGAYGLYPVDVTGLLIEHCEVTGSSDAGIYVGQSKQAIIRNNRTYGNVQGIAIENCIDVDVYENESFDNTSGISVYNLPDLVLKNGYNIKVHNNIIRDNNRENFGEPGAIVGIVPAGTGIFVLSGRNVEIHDNEITGHKTVNAAIASYPITGRPINDPEFYPYSSAISIHNNNFSRTNDMLPDTTRELGKVIAGIFGTDVPDILFDGLIDTGASASKEILPAEQNICIHGNTNVRFANINAPSQFENVSFDTIPYNCTIQPLSSVNL